MTKDKEIVQQIANYVNCHSDHTEEFVKEMACQHRTLQQNFTRICAAWLIYLSELKENQYDDRNAASVKFAQSIKKELESTKFPYI